MIDESRVDVEKSRMLLKKRINRQIEAPGEHETGLAGVRLYRRDQASKPENCLYRPVIIKMVQGYKRAWIGAEEYRYSENEVLVVGVDMPGTSMICEASPEVPSIAITIDLDKNLIAQLALEMPPASCDSGALVKGVLVQPLEAEMLDAFLRLAELFDHPEKLAVMGPMRVREIHYLLLAGPNGHRLRSFHTLGSQSHQISQAISWLKQNLSTAIPIETLAGKVNMAPSTFHRHFKEITSLSPLQYQKRLRLHEAQRLMLAKDMDAGTASVAVGYESLSQFNREYRRLFGEPPLRDVKRLRAEIARPRSTSPERPATRGLIHPG